LRDWERLPWGRGAEEAREWMLRDRLWWWRLPRDMMWKIKPICLCMQLSYCRNTQRNRWSLGPQHNPDLICADVMMVVVPLVWQPTIHVCYELHPEDLDQVGWHLKDLQLADVQMDHPEGV
jgi:hypothetical protein